MLVETGEAQNLHMSHEKPIIQSLVTLLLFKAWSCQAQCDQ